jgi:hypothetical protein
MYCLRDEFVSTESDSCVCTFCGLVYGDAIHCEISGNNRFYGDTYRHIFHWNERMALFIMVDPAIPDDLFDLVADEYHEQRHFGTIPPAEECTYEHIGSLLKSIEVPPDLQEEYRSKKYSKLPFTNMAKKYWEKWLTIKWRLSGIKPHDADFSVVLKLKQFFMGFLHGWLKINDFDKRHNLPNYNLMILIGLEFTGNHRYCHLFPQLKSMKHFRELTTMIHRVFIHNYWEITPTIYYYSSLIKDRITHSS